MRKTRIARSVMCGLAAGAGIAAAGYAMYVGITWRRYGHVAPSSGDEVDALLDRFIPTYDVAARHHTDIDTPTEIALAAANTIDIQRSALVRALFRGRALILRGDVEQMGRPRTLLPWMQSLGWTVLAERPGRAVVVGIVMRPWEPTPTPPAVPPVEFAAFHEPSYVKIVTTWAAEPLGSGRSRFTIATRVATTDATARSRFRRYWAAFSPGSLLIRFVGLGFIKGEAERRARAAASVAAPGVGGSGKVSQPQEIAEGVYRFSIRGSNVYFVRSGASWVLIDAAWANSGRLIQRAAEALFGVGARPAAILLTHAHPDHDGSAPELARMWGVPVYMHPDELPLAAGEQTAIEACPAGPLDRWLVLPLMRVMPPQVHEAIRARGAAFMEVARPLEPGASIPGLPEWECVPTPGHSPGHVAFFRASDRVLIAGDAVLTVNLNSVWDLVRNKQCVSGPPYISSGNWQAAKVSVAALARLEPRVLASGHGIPITAPGAASELRAFADRFSGPDAEQGASKDLPVSPSLA